MIDDSETDAVVEAALHAFVAQRCQRAHTHHLRNGLQAIYASVDVLQRIADGKAGPAFSIDRVRELVRKALRSHEQSINEAVKHLTVQHDERATVELGPLVRELISFINSDAAAHEVVFQEALTSHIAVHARPSIVRLIVLATLARCIDALRGGGQVSVDAVNTDSRVALEFTLRAGDAAEVGDWEFDSKEEAAWNLRAMRRLMARERGVAESHAAGTGDPSAQKIVRLIFQAAPVDTRESTAAPSPR
jgi:hypothetical protein